MREASAELQSDPFYRLRWLNFCRKLRERAATKRK
jgi:hypothetical protein